MHPLRVVVDDVDVPPIPVDLLVDDILHADVAVAAAADGGGGAGGVRGPSSFS